MQKFIEALKRAGSITPRPKEPNPHADVLSRAVAWSIDLMLLYYLLRDIFDRIAMRIFQHNDIRTIEEVKRANFGALARDGIDAWNTMQPGVFLGSPYLHLYLTEVFTEFFVMGLVVVATQMLWGNTPGKFLIGIKIVKRKTFERVERWRYPLRFLAYLPSILPFMQGIIWAHFNKERRTVHDAIAGTVVIQTRDFDWYWSRIKKQFKKN